MEFTQLNKYESLVEKHLRHSHYNFYNLTEDSRPLQPQNLQQLLINIDQINMSRSYEAEKIKIAEQTLKLKSNQSSQETLQCELADTRTLKSDNTVRSRKSNRSLIFAPQKFNKQKAANQGSQSTIRIFYFDLPVCKQIHFEPKSRMADLINDALEAYLLDSKLDKSKIKERSYQYYELRLLANEEGFKADMQIPPIFYDRLVADNIFDSLVLKVKDKQDKKAFKAEPIELISKNHKKNTATIHLYNQLGEELGTLNMDCMDSLEKIFQHIQTNDLHEMRSYFLTENKNDTDGLPRDFQVRNLESNKIYIKAKKYIDQSDWQTKIRPLKSLTLVSREPQLLLDLPIGLSEASQYQEFAVVKVNSMGFEQQRILGIDQTKIYNYDKSVRQEKHKTSFFSKIFGLNQQTGTKKPYRLISDIVQLKKTEKGLIIAYQQKSIPYIVPNAQARDKIFRKLNYLINHCKEERSASSRASRH